MSKEKMTKEKIPEDFTLSLALVDAIPVLFFGANMLLIGRIFSSGLFTAGAVLCLLGGTGKVLWKVLVVTNKINVWWLFIQMRILMPVGFLLMLVSVVVNRHLISISGIFRAVTGFPASLFFLVGVLGMVLMSVFAVKLDNSNLRANWIEQLTNGISQVAFFIGLVFLIFS